MGLLTITEKQAGEEDYVIVDQTCDLDRATIEVYTEVTGSCSDEAGVEILKGWFAASAAANGGVVEFQFQEAPGKPDCITTVYRWDPVQV